MSMDYYLAIFGSYLRFGQQIFLIIQMDTIESTSCWERLLFEQKASTQSIYLFGSYLRFGRQIFLMIKMDTIWCLKVVGKGCYAWTFSIKPKVDKCLAKPDKTSSKLQAIQLVHLSSAFFILGVGTLLATVAFTLELVGHKCGVIETLLPTTR